jgi:hypothetical protein
MKKLGKKVTVAQMNGNVQKKQFHILISEMKNYVIYKNLLVH